jgi:competence protein ComEA
MTNWLKNLALLWGPLLAKVLIAVLACVGFARIGSASAERLAPSMRVASPGQLIAPPPLPPPQPPPPQSQPQPACSSDGSRRPPAVTPDGRVVLNLATEAELVKLPGVGRKRAQAILRLRKRLRRFRSLRQLLRVRGIGFRLLKRIKKHVVLDPPPPPPPIAPPHESASR